MAENLSAEKVKENFAEIKKAIAESCARTGRNANEVKVLAATKSQPIGKIQAAIEAGIKICGENYLQEAEKKINEIGSAVQWHFIGHLQSNKAKKAIELFDCIQIVDSLKLARKINDAVQNPFPIFIEINIAQDKSIACFFDAVGNLFVIVFRKLLLVAGKHWRISQFVQGETQIVIIL